MLDGGVATELQGDGRLWQLTSLLEDPEAVLDVHRQYVRAGCDVISTNTWALPTALKPEAAEHAGRVHWLDAVRLAVRLARQAVAEHAREEDCAVGLCLNGDVDATGTETVELICRALADDLPDLVVLETLSIAREALFEVVQTLIDRHLPVWLSFRRCRHGLCGVYGQHWGGPEGDAFGRDVRRFERMGVDAVLINCIPPDHVDGMVSYLRDFTDLPLGAYPNVGHHTSAGWRSDSAIGGSQYADLAERWLREGAQIIGGCCGVGPDHIVAAGERVRGRHRGAHRPRPLPASSPPRRPAATGEAWALRGRGVHPLPLPDVTCDPGVEAPDTAGLFLWKHLLQEKAGVHARCADLGSGTGLLAVQLALNGAAHVHAIDIDARAVENTRLNAFRNGVGDRVSAAVADVQPWLPEEPYDLVVAHLCQVPTDPFEQESSHGWMDYWGRTLVDQVIAKLPGALAPGGTALMLHLSTLSAERTLELASEHGLEARVVDYLVVPFSPEMAAAADQVARVEQLSDAFHVSLGGEDFLVAYLLELRAA
jgi:S-methylmethionine-dependent homocysteine/selenocysteine methylase/protein-L-isoaspartate O-methyltransferase